MENRQFDREEINEISKKISLYFKMIVFVVIAIFIISVLLLYNQSILFYLVFTLVVAIGEYGTDASIRYWSLIRNQEIEDVKFERVMRYYRDMGILFGAIYLIDLLFWTYGRTMIFSIILNFIVLYICLMIKKEVKKYHTCDWND